MVNKCEVGRFDGDYKIIAFNEGDNVGVILNKAGIELHEGESVNADSGDVVNTSDNAVDGETYSIVGNYKQGQEQETEQEEKPSEEEPKSEEEASEEPTK